jgi:hypothetical protein
MGAQRRAEIKLAIGDLVQIDGQSYEVMPDRFGSPALETRITPMADLHEERGSQSASDEDFERLAGDLPTDDEG